MFRKGAPEWQSDSCEHEDHVVDMRYQCPFKARRSSPVTPLKSPNTNTSKHSLHVWDQLFYGKEMPNFHVSIYIYISSFSFSFSFFLFFNVIVEISIEFKINVDFQICTWKYRNENMQHCLPTNNNVIFCNPKDNGLLIKATLNYHFVSSE